MGRFTRFVFVIASCALFCSGCYRNTIVNDAVSPGPEESSETAVFFIWGMAGDPEIDAREHCKGPIASVSYSAGPIDLLVTTVTLGIVGLRSVDIRCGTARQQTAMAGAR